MVTDARMHAREAVEKALPLLARVFLMALPDGIKHPDVTIDDDGETLFDWIGPRLVAFEPDQFNASLLARNLSLNGIDNVIGSDQGDKITGFTYDRPEEINLYKDGLRLRLGNGRAVLFKFRSVENADFIGLIISKAQNPRMFGGSPQHREVLARR